MEIFVPVASGQGPGAKVGVAMAIIYTSSGTQYTGQDAGKSPAPSGGVSNSGSLSSLASQPSSGAGVYQFGSGTYESANQPTLTASQFQVATQPSFRTLGITSSTPRGVVSPSTLAVAQAGMPPAAVSGGRVTPMFIGNAPLAGPSAPSSNIPSYSNLASGQIGDVSGSVAASSPDSYNRAMNVLGHGLEDKTIVQYTGTMTSFKGKRMGGGAATEEEIAAGQYKNALRPEFTDVFIINPNLSNAPVLRDTVAGQLKGTGATLVDVPGTGGGFRIVAPTNVVTADYAQRNPTTGKIEIVPKEMFKGSGQGEIVYKTPGSAAVQQPTIPDVGPTSSLAMTLVPYQKPGMWGAAGGKPGIGAPATEAVNPYPAGSVFADYYDYSKGGTTGPALAKVETPNPYPAGSVFADYYDVKGREEAAAFKAGAPLVLPQNATPREAVFYAQANASRAPVGQPPTGQYSVSVPSRGTFEDFVMGATQPYGGESTMLGRWYGGIIRTEAPVIHEMVAGLKTGNPVEMLPTSVAARIARNPTERGMIVGGVTEAGIAGVAAFGLGCGVGLIMAPMLTVGAVGTTAAAADLGIGTVGGAQLPSMVGYTGINTAAVLPTLYTTAATYTAPATLFGMSARAATTLYGAYRTGDYTDVMGKANLGEEFSPERLVVNTLGGVASAGVGNRVFFSPGVRAIPDFGSIGPVSGKMMATNVLAGGAGGATFGFLAGASQKGATSESIGVSTLFGGVVGGALGGMTTVTESVGVKPVFEVSKGSVAIRETGEVTQPWAGVKAGVEFTDTRQFVSSEGEMVVNPNYGKPAEFNIPKVGKVTGFVGLEYTRSVVVPEGGVIQPTGQVEMLKLTPGMKDVYAKEGRAFFGNPKVDQEAVVERYTDIFRAKGSINPRADAELMVRRMGEHGLIGTGSPVEREVSVDVPSPIGMVVGRAKLGEMAEARGTLSSDIDVQMLYNPEGAVKFARSYGTEAVLGESPITYTGFGQSTFKRTIELPASGTSKTITMDVSELNPSPFEPRPPGPFGSYTKAYSYQKGRVAGTIPFETVSGAQAVHAKFTSVGWSPALGAVTTLVPGKEGKYLVDIAAIGKATQPESEKGSYLSPSFGLMEMRPVTTRPAAMVVPTAAGRISKPPAPIGEEFVPMVGGRIPRAKGGELVGEPPTFKIGGKGEAFGEGSVGWRFSSPSNVPTIFDFGFGSSSSVSKPGGGGTAPPSMPSGKGSITSLPSVPIRPSPIIPSITPISLPPGNILSSIIPPSEPPSISPPSISPPSPPSPEPPPTAQPSFNIAFPALLFGPVMGALGDGGAGGGGSAGHGPGRMAGSVLDMLSIEMGPTRVQGRGASVKPEFSVSAGGGRRPAGRRNYVSTGRSVGRPKGSGAKHMEVEKRPVGRPPLKHTKEMDRTAARVARQFGK